jgi:PII-like signaling protein
MPAPAKALHVHLRAGDRFEGRPLYEAIVEKCRELKIAGATVCRGIEGYGETAEIHRPGVLAHHLPLVVTVVDTAGGIARLLPEVERMLDKGLIALEDVEVIRIQKSTGPSL